MVIKNLHGEFELNSSHYNWLTHHIVFNNIDDLIVSKTRFIVSSYEYKKANEVLNELLELNLIDINSIRYLPTGLTPFDSKIKQV
jgi:hypothetical protein